VQAQNDNTVLSYFAEVQNVKRQNVEKQNVKRQNVEKQNVKRQNVEKQNVERQKILPRLGNVRDKNWDRLLSNLPIQRFLYLYCVFK
jgi:hypothetical protein